MNALMKLIPYPGRVTGKDDLCGKDVMSMTNKRYWACAARKSA